MRWSTAPLILAAAGAVGGTLDAHLSQLTMGKYGEDAVVCAYVGGGIGLGIGATLCLPGRWGWGLIAAPFLGVLGYLLSLTLCCVVDGAKDFPKLSELVHDPFALYLAAPAAPLLVLGHRLYLRMTSRGRAPVVGLPLYAAFGALSGLLFWILFEHPWTGLLDGALYGLAQHAGISCARGIDRWRVPAPTA
jgi:hypothetical protein